MLSQSNIYEHNPKVSNLTFFRQTFGNTEESAQFMRKGETGDWRNHLNTAQLVRIEEWEQRGLRGTDLSFVYDL